MKSSRSHRTLSEAGCPLTGHLGNTTVLFRDADEDGQIAAEGSGPAAAEVMQRLWYYPFGLQLQGIGRDESAPAHLYRYNGKAWDPASGLSDYGARWYDAGSGRWSGVDPLAAEMPEWSPYNFVFNSPLRFVDPDGRAPEDWIKINGQYQYDAEVTNQNEAVEKYGEGVEYVGETHRYTAFNGGTVQLNENGTWNYMGAPFNPPMITPGAVDEFFDDYYVFVGTSDALGANIASRLSNYVLSRGYNGPNSNIYGNKLSKGDILSLKFGPLEGKNVARLSTGLKYVGTGAAVFGYFSVANQAIKGNISPVRAGIDASVVTWSWRGGLPGAAFGFGYGVLGPLVTNSNTYQRWKQSYLNRGKYDLSY